MKKKKTKILFWIIAIIGILLFLFFYLDTENVELYVNYHIYLPKAYHIDTIYRFDFRDGSDLSILTYSNRKFKNIVSKKEFKKINPDNLEIISKQINDYYSALSSQDKKAFDENVNINQLLDINQNNFYSLTIQANGDFVILLASESENKVYYLNAVQ